MAEDLRGSESAEFYDEIYVDKDYAGEASRVIDLIESRVPSARTLLDVACGTGRHLEQLSTRFTCEGVDINEGLLAHARRRCPGIPFSVGDMTAFDLGHTFDVVTCLFSAIGYAHTPERLRAAVASMARHVAPGGLLLIEPFIQPDEWNEGRVSAETPVNDGSRSLVRMATSRRDGNVAILDMHYLSGRGSKVSYSHEQLDIGLFTWDQLLEAFEEAGLTDLTVDTEGLIGRGMVTGTQPTT